MRQLATFIIIFSFSVSLLAENESWYDDGFPEQSTEYSDAYQYEDEYSYQDNPFDNYSDNQEENTLGQNQKPFSEEQLAQNPIDSLNNPIEGDDSSMLDEFLGLDPYYDEHGRPTYETAEGNRDFSDDFFNVPDSDTPEYKDFTQGRGPDSVEQYY